MLNIIIPDNNLPEREYIIEVLLSDYLGLKYHLTVNNTNKNYCIFFNDSELVIKDSFFNLYPFNLSYLTIDALPKKTVFVKNKFSIENDIPIIYGSDEFSITGDKVFCGIDIFSSSFFMLTRWEEYVNKARDELNRFPGRESIAQKNGFLYRPVVNEYAEMLWALLQKIGYGGERKKRSFELILTHDIDHMDYPGTFRIILGDILKRSNPKLAAEHFAFYFRNHSNPYDVFDFIMTLSERIGLKSHFYFMASNSGQPRDLTFYLNSNRFKNAVRNIKVRGHLIGFHPGYYTYNNMERWSYEKKLLEEAVQDTIIEGRQHYLRFEVPKTFQIWEKNKMEIDSTLGYAEIEGFRCGTGDCFKVFDFLERTQLRLKERPLVIMDGTMQKFSHTKTLSIIESYILSGRKYSSEITLLFHNSTFYGEGWSGYDSLYKRILDF